MLEVYLDTPQDRNIWEFGVEDSKGNIRELQFKERKENIAPVVHLHSRPFPYYSDRHGVYFETGEIPAGGYEVYKLTDLVTFDRKTKFWAKTRKTDGCEIASATDYMENELVGVKVNPDGSITVTDKRTGEIYGPLNYYESTGDVGDYWMYYPPYLNRTYTSKGAQASIYLKENGALSATIGVDLVLQIPESAYRPESYVHGKSERSETLKNLSITTYYTLYKNSSQIEASVSIHNTCRDHRMSVLMESGVNSRTANAQGHFTVDERDALPLKDQDGKYYNELVTQPMQNFLSVCDGTRGMAVITDCLGEYELRTDRTNTMSFTLFRAVKNIICTEFRSEGYFPDQHGGQLLRTLEYHYAIEPIKPETTANELAAKAEMFNIPLKPIQTSVPTKGDGVLPTSHSFYEVRGGEWNCETYFCVEKFLEMAEESEKEDFFELVRKGNIGISANYLNFNDLADCEALDRKTKQMIHMFAEQGIQVDSAMTADINGMSMGVRDVLIESGIQDEVHIEMVTLSQLYGLIKDRVADAPEYTGDLNDWWADGVGSTPYVVKHYKEAQRLGRIADRLEKRTGRLDKELLKISDDNLLLYAEHTWGDSATIIEPYSTMALNQDIRKNSYASKAHEANSMRKNLQFQELGDIREYFETKGTVKAINLGELAGERLVEFYLESFWNKVTEVKIIDCDTREDIFV